MSLRLFNKVRNRIRNYHREKFRSKFPLKGYREQLNEIKFVDFLSDDDLVELNRILNWNCFAVDHRGRRFGNAAWDGKRSEPEVILDRRILLLNDRFSLSDKHVLEIGCFEGIHTVGLSRYARRVTAVDARIENVVKTIVRAAFFGFHPTVFKCDIEQRPVHHEWLRTDVAYHVGTFYHLEDPVRHLFDLQSYIRSGLLLDTHYALEHEAMETYEVGGKMYRFKRYREAGHSDVFSGAYDHSKWLRLDDIVEILTASNFRKVDILERREERNGPRVLLIAEKP
jgi:tRNA (mo5U34)-methyltransferase